MNAVCSSEVVRIAQEFFNGRGIEIDCSAGDAGAVAESWAKGVEGSSVPPAASFSVRYPERFLEYVSGSGATQAKFRPPTESEGAEFVLYDCSESPEHFRKLADELREIYPATEINGDRFWSGDLLGRAVVARFRA